MQEKFLKYCTSKYVGLIVSYSGFYVILAHKTIFNSNVAMEYCPIVGNTLHRDTTLRRK